MLQQTTVSTVTNKYRSFMKRFPSLEVLSKAREEDVVNEWIGLGYYRRARNLKKACEFFLEHHKGEISRSYEELIKCPGIGHYTASAILSIGYNKKRLAIDANIERVLARFYRIKSQNQNELKKIIETLFHEKQILKEVDRFEPRLINEALMDLGREVCRASTYHCHDCPISKNCQSFIHKCQDQYPRKIEKDKKQFELKLVRVICKNKNKILAYKKTDKQWLSGQLEVPTFILKSEDPKLNQYPLYLEKLTSDKSSFKTTITKYKITNYVIKGKILKKLMNNYDWYELDFKKNNFSTASRKAIKIEKRRKPDPV